MNRILVGGKSIQNMCIWHITDLESTASTTITQSKFDHFFKVCFDSITNVSSPFPFLHDITELLLIAVVYSEPSSAVQTNPDMQAQLSQIKFEGFYTIFHQEELIHIFIL